MLFSISIVFFDLRLEYVYVFYKASFKICLNHAYFKVCLRKFYCYYGELGPFKIIFVCFFQNLSIFGIIYSLQKSANFKRYDYLEFGCCIIARQCAIMRLRNMLTICLASWKSEPHYAYKHYAYK